ncbi:phosphatase PAP2 family protein [Streptomyces sp. NPDC050504]|uniref:phosphatase PAP2 family protein n=1 Tax=Streptomyces sp. NPDC050504 TaxID=3365618 RepID=UPI003795BEB6
MNSTELYRDTTDFARSAPTWVQHLAEIWTEAGLLLFGVLFVACWWRARGGDARAMALAALAPLLTAVAYVGSEALKSVVDEDRPCRAVADAAAPLVACPPVGDWSFPSNHATIAGAAAVALLLVRPRLGWLTVPMALLMGFSRVFVGVHYPHDVAVGLAFGAVVAAVGVAVGTRAVRALVEAMRGSGNGAVGWLVGAGPRAGGWTSRHAGL